MNHESLPVHWANRLAALSRRELGQRFRNAGHVISPEEWAILLVLWKKDGQHPGEMSARTVRDPTTMTRLIDSMVKKGVVERRPVTNDRRRSLVCLTDRGRALKPVLVGLAMPMIETSMAGISAEDAEITTRVLNRMVTNLSGGTQTKE